MPTLSQFRALIPGGDKMSDAEIVQNVAKTLDMDPVEIAGRLHFGQSSSGVTGQQFSSAIDRYQAGLYGLGEAVTGAMGAEGASGWLGAQRQENELRADIASRRAGELGAVQQWDDVHGVKDFGSYAKGLAIQSAPYLAESLAGGIGARALMGGTKAALRAAEAAGDVTEVARAKRALDIGATAGVAAASYPSSVADVLSNQREQAGTTDLGSAMALGVPYAAANVIGVEGALARRELFKNTVDLLNKPGGILGGVGRAAATGAATGVKEGASETFQEMVNQAGRMVVDPEAQFFSEDAQKRYKESFIGGAVLGGAMGGGLGGWRRSNTILPGADVAGGNEVSQAINQTDTPSQRDMSAFMGGGGLTGVNPLAGRASLYNQQVPSEPTPPAPPTTPTPPAVTGGTTDIAQAQAQAVAEQQQIQAAQQQQAARDEYTQRFGGIQTVDLGNGQTQYQFGNKNYYTAEELSAAVDKLLGKEQGKPEFIKQAEAAYVATFATPEKPLAPNSVTSQLTKFAANTTSIEQIAARVNGEITSLAKAGKTVQDTRLSKLAEFYENLTGQVAPGYELAQQTATTEKGATNGPLQLQTTTGLGTVREQGGAGEAGSGNVGPVQPGGVQPVGAGSVPEGSLGLQTGQLPGEGIRPSSGAVPSAGNAITAGPGEGQGTLNAEPQAPVQGATQVAGERPADEGAGATVAASQEQILEEAQVESVPNLIRNALLKKYKSAKKIDLLFYLSEPQNRGDYAKLAKDNNLSLAYIKELANLAKTRDGDPHPKFIMDVYDDFLQGVNDEAASSGVSLLDALDALQVIHDTYAEGGPLGTEVNEEDVIAAGMAIQEREERTDKQGEGTGKSDLTNVTNIVDETDYRDRASNAYLAELDAYSEDPTDDNKKLLDAAEAAASATNKSQAQKLFQAYQKLKKGPQNAVQEPSAAEVPVRERAGGGEAVGGGNAEERQAPTEGKQSKTEIAIRTPQEQYDSLTAGYPVPAFSELPPAQQSQIVDLAHRDQLNLAAVNRIMSSQPQQLTNEPLTIDVEARVINETVGPQVLALPEPQVNRLERHYNLKRDTAEFLEKVKEDVVKYATKGAEAVAGAIRDVIKAIHSGVLAVAMIFNPMHITTPEAYVVVPQTQTVTTTKEVKAEVPAEVKGMSEAGKQAYATLIPALKGKNGDKLLVIADKPSGQMFVFDANGNLVVQKKTLYGLAKGDLYKGNNDLPQNRVTPAGLFGLKLVDAAQGGSAAKTAGEYDFGKVFALQDPDAVVTIMHSVWLHEKDASQRAAALQNENPADSRYSFGCINVDKATYKMLLDKYQAQMDGAKLFVVPDEQSKVKDFLAGTVPSDKLVREGVQPVTKTTTTTTGQTSATAGEQRAQVGKEEKGPLFGVDSAITNPYTVAELTKEISDFVRSAVNTRRLKVVGSIQDLLNSNDPVEQKLGAAMALNKAFGVAHNGKAYLIANRITKGQGRAKFMHEVGAHLGMEGLLTDQQFDDLTDKIFSWALQDTDSREATLARKAIARAEAAETADEDLRSEILAYFVEEAIQAGVEPAAAMKISGPLGAWFRTLWAAFKTAIRRLGMNPDKMNAQDVVNIAYGAARLEMHGAYHGTAAEFRRFNHKYMGTGEGAQAFGWGTYVAQLFGIAKGYWQADVRRKTKAGIDNAVAYSYGGLTNFQQRQEYFSAGGAPIKLGLTLNPLRMRSSGLYIPTIESTGGKTPGALSYKAADQILKKDGTPLFSTQQIEQMTQYVTQGANAPEGSVMRVDIGVDEKDMLDWDTRLSKQPSILAKVEAALPQSLKDALVEETNLDLSEMTGEDLYRGLQSLELKEGVVSEQFPDVADYNKRLAGAKPKQVVSTYMDEILGVPGLKFLDAESRYDVTTEEVKLNNLRELLKDREAALDRATAQAAFWEKEYDNASGEDKVRANKTWQATVSYRTSLEFSIEQDRQEIEKGEKLLAHLQNPTRNLVIFNDKNIFRAGSRVGNQRNKMKFGKTAAAEGIPETPPVSVFERMPQQLRSSTERTWKSMFKNLALPLAITEDVIKMASKYMKSAERYLSAQYKRQAARLEIESRVEQILDRFDKLDAATQKLVNEYIYDSTMQQKWGFYPGEHRVGTKLFEVDPDFEDRFNLIASKSREAGQLIEDVFEHGYQMMKLKERAVDTAVDREFKAREDAAMGDPDTLAELAKEKRRFKKREMAIRNIQVDKPYAYLGRHGDYVVVAKSKEFIAAEEIASGTRSSATGDSVFGDPQQAKNWLQENISNPDHYVVQFAETQGEVDKVAAELVATGKYDVLPQDAGVKEANASYSGGDAFLAVKRLRNLADRQGDADGRIEKLMSDLYLATVAEASARKSELQRKYVAGADKNMMRNLATSGRADAHFLSTMLHNDEVVDSLEAMRTEARDNRREAMPIYNELYNRYAKGMEYKDPSPFVRSANQLSTVFYLSTSPAFYLQQMLQTAVLSLPYMSGRLGYFRSARAINTAYNDTRALVKGLSVTEHIDFNRAPADVRGMLQTLVGMGKIDIGIDADAKARSGESGPMSKVMRKLQGVNSRIEAINRATAAIAAYRGYLQRYGQTKTAEATKFAADVVSNTHGSYDGFNTPRVLSNDFGRFFLQFKRFQIIQLSMLGKLIHESFKGSSQEERVIARKALGFITAHMAVLGGALGVPFVSQLGQALLSAFGDDDEPADLEHFLRKHINDKDVADLLLRGAPGGVGLESLGKKLSMENVASILPFTQVDLTSRSGMEKVLVGLMGPTAALGLKAADALGLMSKGDYYKGLEQMLPTGAANIAKGLRFATEGVTMRNGDTVMGADDISALDAAFQAVGLPTSKITDRQRTQKVVAEFDQFYQDRSSELKGAYAKAFRQGDTGAMQDVREAWTELQESRVRNGYTRQSMSTLFRAPQEQAKRERNVAGGVEFDRSKRQLVERLATQ